MKGIPTYTQQSVAFPTLPSYDRELDAIDVSFSAKGGGTHGEFRFVWIEFRRPVSIWPGSNRTEREPRYPNGALKVSAFSDGWAALLDPRIVAVLDAVKRRRDRDRDIPPDALIELLEANGVRASTHHLRGKNEPTYGARPSYWPDADRKAYEYLIRRDAA